MGKVQDAKHRFKAEQLGKPPRATAAPEETEKKTTGGVQRGRDLYAKMHPKKEGN